MGSGRWSSTDWDRVATTRSTQSQSQVFTSRSMLSELNPHGVVRESVDSEDNPNSTPIIITCDVTGSMGITAEEIVKKSLGTVMKEIYDRKPVTDPHICGMATGDAFCDRAPLQVTQFEADIRISDQMAKIWIEGNGGGNGGESYMLPWYFAAYHVKADAITKRGKKGYIFTIGDEHCHSTLTRDQIKNIFGDDIEQDLSTKDLLTIASENWNIFHLIVLRPENSNEVKTWKALLGERAMVLTDLSKLGEVIVSTMQVMEGSDVDTVVNSWSGNTAVVVRDAIKDIVANKNGSTGVVRL